MREEAELIKSEFARIADRKNIDPELSMLMLLNFLVTIFLEKTTKKITRTQVSPLRKPKKMNLRLLIQVLIALERIKEHEAAVLLFAKLTDVPFTNNRAERDLRMAKVKQKVSGCFRKELYAHAYCWISSYSQTMANKGYNPLIAIQVALAGNVLAREGRELH